MKISILSLRIVLGVAVCLTAFHATYRERYHSARRIPGMRRQEELDKPMNIPRHPQAPFTYRTEFTVSSDYPNIDCNPPGNSDIQGETSVAINPLNPNIVIAGANDYRSDTIPTHQIVYLSTDGGATWNDNDLPQCPGDYSFVSDPSLVYDANGVAYFGFGALSNYLSSAVMVQRSTDGGLNWQSPSMVDSSNFATALEDKYYVGADASPSSPFKNNVYISWTHYLVTQQGSYGQTYLYFSRSTDEGVTWQPPQTLDSNGYFSMPAVGPNGDVYVAWTTYPDPTTLSLMNIMIARSTDGGATFGAPASINGQALWSLPPSFPNKDTLRMISSPSISIDRSPLHRGRIYITWAGLDGFQGAAHIYLSYSDDNGADWTNPQIVDGDMQTQTDKFFPWLACDPATGTVAISYYDSRNDPVNNATVDVYLSYSNDGAQSFNTVRITNTSFGISTSGTSFGSGGYWADYTGIAALNGKIIPCWTDQRSGNTIYNTDVYVSIIESGSGVASGAPAAPSTIAMSNYPNPFSSAATIRLDGIPADGIDARASLKIYDAAGNVVADLTPELVGSSPIAIPFDSHALPSGAYYAMLHTKYGDVRKQLAVIR